MNEIEQGAYDRIVRLGGAKAYIQKERLALFHFLTSTYLTRLLLDHGAPLENTNKNGRTALMEAMWSTFVPFEVVALLLERGANVNAERIDGPRTNALELGLAVRFDFQCIFDGLSDSYWKRRESHPVCLCLLARYGAKRIHKTSQGEYGDLVRTMSTLVVLCIPLVRRSKGWLTRDTLRYLHGHLLLK